MDKAFYDRGYRLTRLENGDVLLETIYDTIRIPKHQWCSDIATASYYGEEDYGFYRAANFHYKNPIDKTSPVRDKPVSPMWSD